MDNTSSPNTNVDLQSDESNHEGAPALADAWLTKRYAYAAHI